MKALEIWKWSKSTSEEDIMDISFVAWHNEWNISRHLVTNKKDIYFNTIRQDTSINNYVAETLADDMLGK